MELDFDMHGVARKLVEYVVHLFKRKKIKSKYSFLTMSPNNKQLVFGLKEF
jgi:hypothetical protein